MQVLMLSKACIVGTYQRKLEELAKFPDIQLTVIVPPGWKDDRGEQLLERTYTDGYDLEMEPIRFNGHFHFHYYPHLGTQLQRLQPDILHIDEEPYNYATRHAMIQARKLGIRTCFFTWQNLLRSYPPPFRWWEQAIFRQAAHAIAGNHAASHVLRAKGYDGNISIIPQFGVDTDLFSPDSSVQNQRLFTIGYAGGFVAAKGVDTLLRACSKLQRPWQLLLAGSGGQEASLKKLAERLDIASHVHILPKRPSMAMPAFYHELDVFVLPSRTLPNWMEQFGRVLIEAMACGVPVIGSSSGEIPFVIDDAGLVFEEDEPVELAALLATLQSQPQQRSELARRGRARVLEHYTQSHIARETYQVYRSMMADQSPPNG